jgi:hypothetical protein
MNATPIGKTSGADMVEISAISASGAYGGRHDHQIV